LGFVEAEFWSNSLMTSLVWLFTVDGKKMEGTLTRPDKTVFRRGTLKKEEWPYLLE